MKFLISIIVFTLVFMQTKCDEKVKLNVYYESLCPDSSAFITQQLSGAYNQILDIMDVKLFPFGKANYTKTEPNDLWKFECQHGDDECYGNRIHNCYIEKYPKFEDHFQFIKCCMSDIRIPTNESAKKCSDELNIPIDSIIECANGKLGNDLLYQTGNATLSLSPKLTYVPWININDVHTDKDQNGAENGDLTKLVCNRYAGSKKPLVCNNGSKFFANYFLFALIAFLLIRQ